MQDRHGTQVEEVVLHGRPMLRATDQHGYHVGYHRNIAELAEPAQVVDVASLVEAARGGLRAWPAHRGAHLPRVVDLATYVEVAEAKHWRGMS